MLSVKTQDHGGVEERKDLPICPKILTKAEPVIQDLSRAARQTCSARSSVVSGGNWGGGQPELSRVLSSILAPPLDTNCNPTPKDCPRHIRPVGIGEELMDTSRPSRTLLWEAHIFSFSWSYGNSVTGIYCIAA